MTCCPPSHLPSVPFALACAQARFQCVVTSWPWPPCAPSSPSPCACCLIASLWLPEDRHARRIQLLSVGYAYRRFTLWWTLRTRKVWRRADLRLHRLPRSRPIASVPLLLLLVGGACAFPAAWCAYVHTAVARGKLALVSPPQTAPAPCPASFSRPCVPSSQAGGGGLPALLACPSRGVLTGFPPQDLRHVSRPHCCSRRGHRCA